MTAAVVTGADVWRCPSCGRGSPDPRDEAAHLDAHGRLRRDPLTTRWDLIGRRVARQRALPPAPVKRPRGATVVLAAIVMCGMLLALSAGLFYGTRGTPERIGPAPAAPPMSEPSPVTSSPVPPAAPPPPPTVTVVSPAPVLEAPPAPQPGPPPLVVSPRPPGAPTATIPIQPVRPPSLCVLNICLAL